MDNIPETQLKEFKDAFETYDKNKDGTITIKDLALVLRALNNRPSDLMINEIITEWDKEKHEKINFEEFVKLMKVKNRDNIDLEQELINAFRVFDTEGTGLISISTMRHIMASLGEKLSEEEVEAMLYEADVDGDGYINYEEFVRSRLNK
jgi:Ca2+-binding EF-hand superfamily protein